MEHYQEAPSQILRAIRACVTQEGEWTRDLPWMSQPALTASDRGISNRLTGRKVAKASRLWVGHKKMGVISLYFALGVIRTFLGHAPSPGKRRGLSRLASLLHSAAAGVGDSVTPWGMSCLRVGSVAILCPALCRVWRRSGGGTIATAGRTRGGSSRPAVLSAQSACIVKRKGSTMLALSTASGCYVLIF